MTPNFHEKAREIDYHIHMMKMPPTEAEYHEQICNVITHALRASYLSGLRLGAEIANDCKWCFGCKVKILAEVEKVEKEK